MTDYNTDEAFEILWQTYPSDLAHKRKGSKVDGRRAFDKKIKSQDSYNDVMSKLRVLVKYWRAKRDSGVKVDRWPFFSTWVNGERWTDIAEIGEFSQVGEKKDAACCSTQGCNNPVGWKTICWSCYDATVNPDFHKKMQGLANENKRTGCDIRADETPQQWYARCRQFCVDRGYTGRAVGGSR